MSHTGTSHEGAVLAATHFDRTTTIHHAGEDESGGRFLVDLDESWAALLGVHGGYLTALAVRAAEATAPDRGVRTVATTFLRPAQVGPAEIHVHVVRSGRSFTTIDADVHQGGRVITNTRVTMLSGSVGHRVASGAAVAGWTETVTDRPASLSRCVPFASPASLRHFENAEFLIDPETIPHGDADHARIAGHVRPLEVRPLDAGWLVMIGDWFPPSPFRRVNPPVGGVSIDYTVHIHRTVAAQPELWLEGVFTAGTNLGGIALEHGSLAMPDGTLVAEIFHTRWTG
ncbi:MAG: thioesterase family protein [Ilumatobacteraceae bacterium]